MEPVVNVFNHKSQLVKFEDSEHNKFDSRNRKILEGTFRRNSYTNDKIALAHHASAVPVYLIEIKEKISV